jgi:hypothetical protein
MKRRESSETTPPAHTDASGNVLGKKQKTRPKVAKVHIEGDLVIFNLNFFRQSMFLSIFRGRQRCRIGMRFITGKGSFIR